MITFTSRQLRAFVLVAQHRNFARAADALFITPSGLSVIIRQLETQVGCRLFDRTTRHVALTTNGRELLPAAARSLQELDETVHRIGSSARLATQSISVGASPLIAANVLPLAIKEFQSQRPDLRIRLFDSDLTTLLERVASGALDLGVGAFEKAPGIRRTPFFRFSLMVVRAEGDRGARRTSMTWSALNGSHLILLRPESPVQKLIDKHLALAKVVPGDTDVVNALDTQIAMVEAGHGIAVIPSFGLPACRNRRVVMTRLINPIVTLDLHAIRSRAVKLPAGADDFTTFLQGYIATWAGRAGIL